MFTLDKKKRKKIYIFAHNGHKYDDMFLLPLLFEKWNSDVEIIGGVSQIKLITAGKYMVFRDTMELMP